MRKLVVALSLVTVTLAVTTAYFARELQRERAQKASVVEPTVAKIPVTAAMPTRSTDRGDASPAVSPIDVSGEESLEPMERAKRQVAANAERELPTLLDPAKRRAMLDESKARSRGTYPQLAQFLHLSDDEYDSLLELLAEQQITTRETMLRCALDSRCKFPGVDRAYHESQELEVAALIGADRQQGLVKYLNSLNERRAVAQLRGRLPDKDHLSDAQAERLIAAVADEHQRFEAGIVEGGAGVSGYNMGGVSFVLSGEEAGSEKRLAEANEYLGKVRERAAQVLTAGQLTIFDEMLDEGFRQVQFQLRQDGEKPVHPQD